MIDVFDQWAEHLASDLNAIDNIQHLLGADDVFGLEKLLLLNATVCRALFDEAASLSVSLHAQNRTVSGYNRNEIQRLNSLANKQIRLSGCITGQWKLGQELKLSYRKICDKIIHVNSLQLWKSPNPKDPSFFINSAHDVKENREMKFYHLRWSQFGSMLRDVVGDA